MSLASSSSFVLAAALLPAVLGALQPNSTPEFIKPCQRNDPEINDCLRQSFDHLRPYLYRGIPEIKLAPLEPLLIPKMTMENGHGAIRIKGTFSNITVHGATNYTIQNVKGDVNKYKMDLTLGIPRIEVTGNYEVVGQVLLFPVRSRGEFWAMFVNITGLGRINGKEIKRDGTTFMKTERLGVDFKLQKARFKIKDQLNANSVIGEAMNRFMNENAIEVIDEMKPAAAQAIGKHFKGFLNAAFLQVPLGVWLKN